MGKGMGGHQSARMGKDEWLSPPEVIGSLGKFDLDPCSPIDRPWSTAAHHFTIEDDGLLQQWFGRVWMNPPYGRALPDWLNKLALHGNGIALTFARTDTRAFQEYVFPYADSILFIKRRLHFYHVDGTRAKDDGGAPSVLIAYGENNVASLSDCKIPGRHVYLNYTPIVVVGVTAKWITVVTMAVNQFGDKQLAPLYDMVERIAPDKILSNQHWKAKVRQQLQLIREKRNNSTFENGI